MHSCLKLAHRTLFRYPLHTVTIHWAHYRNFSTSGLTTQSPPLLENIHILPRCPYLPGAPLSLEMYPFNFDSGFSSPQLAVSAHVLKSFLPFTNSQAIKVRIEPSPSTSSLPGVVVLKLFDRRFVKRNFLEEAWSPERESDLCNRVKDFLLSGRCVMPATLPEIFGLGTPNGKPADVNCLIDPQFFDLDVNQEYWSNLKPWQKEVRVYERMFRRVTQEGNMYAHLSALQGIRIPRLYGIVQCVLSQGSPGDDLISRVPGLILECVDGKTLRDLKVGENISAEEGERVSQDVLSSIRELRKFRVLHGDIRRANIVVRDIDLRPFIIDFGESEEYTSATEEQWVTYRSGLHELLDARTFLDEQGLHSPSPTVHPADAFHRGFRTHNRVIEQKDEKWRQKYVERIELHGPPSEERVDENGKAYTWEFARWRFRPGVKTTDAIEQ